MNNVTPMTPGGRTSHTIKAGITSSSTSYLEHLRVLQATRIATVILGCNRSIVTFIIYDLFQPHSDGHFGLNRMTHARGVTVVETPEVKNGQMTTIFATRI